jgi:hypothetical protein
MSKFKGVRWVMIGMIFMLTVINYIDRMTLSVLAPTIMEEFNMSNVSYSRVVTMFLAIGFRQDPRPYRHASRVHHLRFHLDRQLDAARSSAQRGAPRDLPLHARLW